MFKEGRNAHYQPKKKKKAGKSKGKPLVKAEKEEKKGLKKKAMKPKAPVKGIQIAVKKDSKTIKKPTTGGKAPKVDLSRTKKTSSVASSAKGKGLLNPTKKPINEVVVEIKPKVSIHRYGWERYLTLGSVEHESKAVNTCGGRGRRHGGKGGHQWRYRRRRGQGRARARRRGRDQGS